MCGHEKNPLAKITPSAVRAVSQIHVDDMLPIMAINGIHVGIHPVDLFMLPAADDLCWLFRGSSAKN